MNDNADLVAALRRELDSVRVPFDGSRAEEMIRNATTVPSTGRRNWHAPLAAAAAVVVIGGGATLVTEHVGDTDSAGPRAKVGHIGVPVSFTMRRHLLANELDGQLESPDIPRGMVMVVDNVHVSTQSGPAVFSLVRNRQVTHPDLTIRLGANGADATKDVRPVGLRYTSADVIDAEMHATGYVLTTGVQAVVSGHLVRE